VRVGPLSGVVPRSLLSAFELASEGTPLQGARLAIEETPILALCPRCAQERPIQSVGEFRCADCGTLAPEVIGGRELDLVSLEISGEPADC
jgi:hydrogenase nickel incorporation protein HypA/HybF